MLTLLVATILTSSLLVAKPWRRGPRATRLRGDRRDPGPEGRGDLTVAVVKRRRHGDAGPGPEGGAATRRAGATPDHPAGEGPARPAGGAEGLEVLSGSVTIGADPGDPADPGRGLVGRGTIPQGQDQGELEARWPVDPGRIRGPGREPPPLIEVRGPWNSGDATFWTTDQAVASGAVSLGRAATERDRMLVRRLQAMPGRRGLRGHRGRPGAVHDDPESGERPLGQLGDPRPS